MKKLSMLITLLLVGLLAVACSSMEAEPLSDMQMSKVVNSKGTTILDARMGSKWDNKERVPGASGMNLKSSDAEIQAQLPDKAARIVTYCGSDKCPMSSTLAKRLKGLGYSNVSEYPSGLQGWKAAGNKVVKVK